MIQLLNKEEQISFSFQINTNSKKKIKLKLWKSYTLWVI